MANHFMQHTWQTRTASTCCVSPLRTSHLQPLEEDLTAFVRRMHATKTSSKRDDTSDHELQVVVSWIQEMKPPVQRSSDNLALSSAITAAHDGHQRHLNIEVLQRVRNHTNHAASTAIGSKNSSNSKAQLILCFCKGNEAVDAFAFVLVHGVNPMIQILVRWLESRAGVIISQRSFGFTPSQVAMYMTNWTVAALKEHEQQTLLQQKQQQQQHGSSLVEDYEETDTISSELSATQSTTTMANPLSSPTFSNTYRHETKPLDLTFGVPEVVANKGLDTISLSILPVDLLKLYRDIEDRRPRKDRNNGMAQNEAELPQANSVDDTPTPILKALQCYMLEVFHIDIRSFPLIRASSSAAMLSCDGRCKVNDERFLHLVLHDIKTLVQKRLSTLQNNDGVKQQT